MIWQTAGNWQPANVNMSIIAPTWQRNRIRKAEVAKRFTL